MAAFRRKIYTKMLIGKTDTATNMRYSSKVLVASVKQR